VLAVALAQGVVRCLQLSEARCALETVKHPLRSPAPFIAGRAAPSHPHELPRLAAEVNNASVHAVSRPAMTPVPAASCQIADDWVVGPSALARRSSPR
jgi:hypothetical protein